MQNYRISFAAYALAVRDESFPAWVDSRSKLVDYMLNSHLETFDAIGQANDLWASYIDWLVSIRPTRRFYSFKRWLRTLHLEALASNEQALVKAALSDRKFPCNKTTLDSIINYLESQSATESAIDAADSLWVKYRSGDL